MGWYRASHFSHVSASPPGWLGVWPPREMRFQQWRFGMVSRVGVASDDFRQPVTQHLLPEIVGSNSNPRDHAKPPLLEAHFTWWPHTEPPRRRCAHMREM